MIAALVHAPASFWLAVALLAFVLPLILRGMVAGSFAIAPFVEDVINDLGWVLFTAMFLIGLIWLNA